LDWQQNVGSNGYRVTPVLDRNTFNAIYIKKHEEVLFEIALEPPGLAHNESSETIAGSLMQPEQYVEYREQLHTRLILIEVERLDK